MNRVIVEKKSKLTIQNDSIIVNDTKIPMRLIESLYISSKVDISLKELSIISKKDIPVLVVTNKPKEFIFIQKQYVKNGDLKYKQYKALNNRVKIAKEIIKSKILNSQKSLKKLDLDIKIDNILQNLKNCENVDEIMGIEGSFSREYFKRYFSIFPKILAKGYRTKQPPQDPVNAILSFLYTIFYYEISSQLNYFGYETTIGYLHTPFRNHMALSSDILEYFRSSIDEFTAKLFLEKVLTVKDFYKKDGVYLKSNSRKELWKHLKPFLEIKEKEIQSQISELKKMIEISS